MFLATDKSGDNLITLDEYLTAMGRAPQQMHKLVIFNTPCQFYILCHLLDFKKYNFVHNLVSKSIIVNQTKVIRKLN